MRVKETCAGWENGWSVSTWTRWLPQWNPPPSNSMSRRRLPVAVRSRVDVLDVEGRLIDFKTAFR